MTNSNVVSGYMLMSATGHGTSLRYDNLDRQDLCLIRDALMAVPTQDFAEARKRDALVEMTNEILSHQ